MLYRFVTLLVFLLIFPLAAQAQDDPTPVCGDGVCEGAEADDPNACPSDCLEYDLPEQGAFEVPTAPGRYIRALEHDGQTRIYMLMVPPSYEPPAPLILVFHGSGQTARSFVGQRENDFFNNAGGAVMVFPQSTVLAAQDRPAWNSRGADFESDLDLPDDVGFALALIEHLAAGLRIDASRVYAVGFSNGGQFTQLLVSQHPDVFAAGASVAGGIGYPDDNEAEAPDLVLPPLAADGVPMMIVNGRQDPVRPWEGGRNRNGLWTAPVDFQVIYWLESNRCSQNPTTATNEAGTVQRQIYANCETGAEVIFIGLSEMPHQWPDGGRGYDFNANHEVLAFLLAHQR